MKKLIIVFLVLIILGYGSYSLYLVYQDYNFANSPEQKVLIAYNKAYLKNAGSVLDAYKSMLTEEGVSWEAVEISSLVTTSAKKLVKTKPVIIFPDGLLQSMPEQTLNWVKEYLDNAGNIAIIYDVGIKEHKGYFRKQALLTDITGVNYITYSTTKERAYTTGFLQLASQQAVDYLQIPPGKSDDNLFLNGYMYGRLRYPIARNEHFGSASGNTVLASAITENGDKYPAVVLNTYGRGNVLYINLPLGYLKAHSDGLPLHVFLRAFLFQTVKIPHLVNVEKDLRYSIHITAGDFRDESGDGLGFDACGKGKSSAELFLPFGTIGSHGGWAHNWFADNVEKGKLTKDAISSYINKNKTCLETITDYPLLEYSAPVGVHPQPLTTAILEQFGFNSYYYTGDSGSAPNRTFHNGSMVTSQVIAFPVLSYGKSASLYEMKEMGHTEQEVQKWLFDVVDYVINNRTTRLFYSHLHDINNYPRAVHNFLQYAKIKKAEGKLRVEPMSVVAGFFLKFIATEFSFRQEGRELLLTLKNNTGLQGITVAIPRNKYRAAATANVSMAEDKDYYYLTVNEDAKENTIIVHAL
jgi:hypothetical protein